MSGRARPLDLGELIDLELQFAADRDADRQVLRERDDRIGRRIGAELPGDSRHELFRRWLADLRDEDSYSVGERVETLYRWIGLGLAVAAFFVGAGTARAVLAYDGTFPVNIIHFLAVFVAAQLALLALWIAAMVPAVRSAGHRAYAPVHEIIRQLVYRRFAGRGGRFAPLLGRLGALGTLYGGAERWRLMSLTQRAAFSFNLGALVTCLYLIAFTDLAFAWSTTLDVRSETMTALLHAIAWPWRWLDAAVPSPALVEASRYFRLAGRYDPHALKDWWAFLLAALMTYGLLPRFTLWQFSAWRARSIRRSLPLDHGDSQVAYERLTRCRHGWCGPEASKPRTPVDGPARTMPPAPLAPRADGLTCTVVRWADVPLDDANTARLIADRFGWRVGAMHTCGGRDSAEETSRVLAAVAAEPRERPLVVLAEAWEAPSRAVTRFLSELRRASNERRNVVVGLLGARNGTWTAPDPDDYDVWRRGTAALGDPYLRVEPMIGDAA